VKHIRYKEKGKNIIWMNPMEYSATAIYASPYSLNTLITVFGEEDGNRMYHESEFYNEITNVEDIDEFKCDCNGKLEITYTKRVRLGAFYKYAICKECGKKYELR